MQSFILRAEMAVGLNTAEKKLHVSFNSLRAKGASPSRHKIKCHHGRELHERRYNEFRCNIAMIFRWNYVIGFVLTIRIVENKTVDVVNLIRQYVCGIVFDEGSSERREVHLQFPLKLLTISLPPCCSHDDARQIPGYWKNI